MAHMSIPCHEGPPATAGHLCSEPAMAGGGRYYCIDIDLEKAYDRVPLQGDWICMREKGVPEKYVMIVQYMYE